MLLALIGSNAAPPGTLIRREAKKNQSTRRRSNEDGQAENEFEEAGEVKRKSDEEPMSNVGSKAAVHSQDRRRHFVHREVDDHSHSPHHRMKEISTELKESV